MIEITIKEIKRAEANDVSYDLLRKRIWKGMDREEAITTPKRGSVKKRMLKLAEKNNIPVYTYDYRVHRLDWEPERAATEPIAKGRRKDERMYAFYQGETLLKMGTLDELVEFSGMKRTTLQWMKTPAYQKRNETGLRKSIVCLDDEEEDDAI